MTVSTLASKIQFSGNGSNTTFAFPFALTGGVTPGVAATLLTVIYTDPSGNQFLISYGPGNTQYQLTINSPVSPNPTGVGGVVTYNPLGTPIPFGSTLTVIRNVPETQPTSLVNQGTLWQSAIEQALDNLAMQIQQLQTLQNNIVQGPQNDPPGLNYTLPIASRRANQGLVFDSAGNVATGVLPSSGVISSAMAPVTGAATLAAGRTAFGLGSIAVENIGLSGTGLGDDGAGNAKVIINSTGVIGPLTVSTSNYLQHLIVTALGVTLTLNQANTYIIGTGFGFWVNNQSGGLVTITPNAADNFRVGSLQYASGASFTVLPDMNVFVYTAGGNGWFIEGGSVYGSAGGAGFFRNLFIGAGAGNLLVSVTADLFCCGDNNGNKYEFGGGGGANVNLGVNGVFGLDTGTVQPNTWYSIWALFNPSTQGGGLIASLQATANATFLSHLPAGFSAWGRLGWVRTNTGPTAFYPSIQKGRTAQWTPAELVNSGAAGTYSATTPVLAGISWAGAAPPTASALSLVLVNTYNGGTAANAILAPNNNYTGISGSVPPPANLLASAAGVRQVTFLTEVGAFYYAADAAGGAVFALGWEDNI